MKQQRKPRPKAAKRSGYKLRNWKSYNQALKQRGSLEIWIDDQIEKQWYYQGPLQLGAQFIYSDECIEMACIVREVYKLPYRQTAGFLESFVKLKGWDVVVPDYSTLNRRHRSLQVRFKKNKQKGKIYIVVDSTGAKVY